MRLSLPRWGHTADRVVIRGAEAVAYRVPMDLTAEDTNRTTAPFNYLISITGDAGGRTFTGLAEAQLRPHQTDDAHDRSWPFLDAQLDALMGETIDVRDALDEVRARAVALEHAAGPAESGERFALRATVTGIETALLDLTARVRGLSLADLLGRSTVRPPATTPLLRHREPELIVSHFHSRTRHRPDAVRLLGEGIVDDDLEHLRQTAALRRVLRPKAATAPIWMNFRGRLDADAAAQIITAVVEGADGRTLPPLIVLQNLLPRDDQGDLGRLQGLADSLSREHEAIRDIRILPYNVGPGQTEELLADGDLRMLNVRPQQLGGVLRTLDLSRRLAAESPATGLVLSQFPGASKVTQMVQKDVATGMPNVVLAASRADIDDEFRVARRSSHLLRTSLLREGDGLRINHHALVKRARGQILHPRSRQSPPGAPEPNTYDDVGYIAPIGAYAVHGHIVEREALAAGLNSWRFSKSSFVAYDDAGARLPFRTARWPLTGVVASSVARHKEATRILLQRAGCPVPQGRTFHGNDSDLALQYAEQIGYPVVLKPAEGSMGAGVTANIPDASELQSALDLLKKSAHGTGEFIVEKHVNGHDYRIMVIGDEVFAAVRRIPANVIGDGVHTIGQLMIARNMIRRENSHLGPLKVKWNAAVRHQLTKQGLTIDTVLREGRQVFLLSTNNLTQGGDSIEILDELHPSIKEACLRAVRAIPGIGYCGVDFLLEDHTRPIDEQEAAICELNAMAALPVAEYPVYGTPRRISEEYIRRPAEAFGLTTRPERAETLDLELTIAGGVTGVGYGRWFQRQAEKSGVDGWIDRVDERTLEARIAGPTAAVTALVTLAIVGPPKAAPTSVRTEHATGPLDVTGFVLLHSESDEDETAAAVEPGTETSDEELEETDSPAREASLEDMVDATGSADEADDSSLPSEADGLSADDDREAVEGDDHAIDG